MNLLLVDFNNTLIRSYFALQSLQHNGIPTGGIYGFLKTVSIHSSKYKIDRIVVCHDRGPYFRKKFYSGFKESRSSMDTNLAEHLNLNKKWAREALDICGIPQWEVKGFEADDLIAYLVKANKRNSMIVLSNDSDMFQLLKKKRDIQFSTNKGLFGYKQFQEKYPNLSSKQYVEMQALAGNHNDVPGIPRVGEITALKWMNDRARFAAKFEEHKNLVARNTKLLTLPTTLVKAPPIPDLRHSECNERKLIRFCGKLGIDLSNSMLYGLSRLGDI